VNTTEIINEMPHAQRERLAFIDFCLHFFGHITRNDLVNRFQTGLAACTRDFAAYRELASTNLLLDHSTKQYYRTAAFVALFKYQPDIFCNRSVVVLAMVFQMQRSHQNNALMRFNSSILRAALLLL